MQQYGDNFIFVLPDDQPLHTAEHPFCYNPSCPCHEDQELLAQVNLQVQEGHLTPEEATAFVQGRTV